MDTQTLSTFLQVAKSGSFTRASETLHLTQPAISKRIANLENSLNCQLFDRIGKDVKLTPSGELFLQHAEQLNTAFQNCLTDLNNFNNTIVGTLNIGVSHHIGLHRLPPYLKQFSKAHPRVQLQINFVDSEDAFEAVNNGEIDFALATLSNQQQQLSKRFSAIKEQAIWPDPLAFATTHDHPLQMLAKNKALSLADLVAFPAILPNRNTITGQIIDEIFTQQSLTLNETIETNNLETIRMMTNIGLGWSILPRNMMNNEVLTLNIEQVFLSRQLGLVTHKERSLANASKAFIAMLPNSAKS